MIRVAHLTLLTCVTVGALAQLGVPCSAAEAAPAAAGEAPNAPELTPEQKMARRFPQPVRVGFMVGLPVLNEHNAIVGYVREVVRTDAGKIQVIVPHGGLFGVGSRLVAVPVEAVAMLGAQIAVMDFPAERFEQAPTWYGSSSTPIPPDETIRVGVTRR